MTDVRRLLFSARRTLARHRRPVAVVLAGLTVLALARVLEPPAEPSVAVVVARHDLAAGKQLGEGDVRTERLPAAAVPDGAARTTTAVLGRTVAAPVGADEVITPQRLVSGALVRGLGDENVAAPVRIADADAVRLLRVGDRIDVYAPTTSGLSATAVLRDALVVGLPQPDPSVGASEGALVVVAVSAWDAGRLAQQAARTPLSFSLLG
jgi:pilus assembly protein CpaB